jgi:hypothetical protein
MEQDQMVKALEQEEGKVTARQRRRRIKANRDI